MDPEARRISLQRAEELKNQVSDYLDYSKKVSTGFDRWEQIQQKQQLIKDKLGASDEDWRDWKWQLRNRIYESDKLEQFLNITGEEKKEIDLTGSIFRWAVVPYYLSLINEEDPQDPIRFQSIPTAKEYYDECGIMDPMGEEYTAPAPAVTRRYPDRLIINVTNQCASYCRHCQRRRNIGEVDYQAPTEDLKEALKYVADNEEIRDVLLTGGDAFMLSDETLDWLLTELDNISHVEIKRLGVRVPVTLPYRVTDELCSILSKHLPLYVNTHFNHPAEITPESRDACLKLARAGINLGNQAVLLKGINNHPLMMKKLNHELLKIMVKPYYIFHAKGVRGTSHFRTKVEEGIEIMEHLRGHTSGIAIPTYVVNAPHGYGKIPVFPQYMVSMGRDKIWIRTWEKRVMEYENEENI